MNILTFDIEEWFHLLDFDSTRSEAQWDRYEVRIYENVERILRLLDETGARATFFVIGWVAKKYPDLIRRISERYEVGSHTMTHQLVWQQTKQAFRDDAERSVKMLQDITGQAITAFRAPGFSIRETECWAFETLHELGIRTDSSVFPAHHAHGGMPSYGDRGPAVIRCGGAEIKEFPVTTQKVLGRPLVFSGGGYFRLCPYGLIKRWSRDREYLLAYIHPRDLDAGQPVLEGLPLARRFKSYVGLRGAEQKLRRYLTDFRFTDLRTAGAEMDWSATPAVALIP